MRKLFPPAGEEVWEKYGCYLWDLTTDEASAKLMVRNSVLDFLFAQLTASQNLRVTHICLGIIGNLACQEFPIKCMAATPELIELILDQLHLYDRKCVFKCIRIIGCGLQSEESIKWAEAMQARQTLSQIFWITENTLHPPLFVKSIGLLLDMLQRQEVAHILLTPLLELGLHTVIANVFEYEMGKLKDERTPERYCVLDAILRMLEAFYARDGYSLEISSDKKILLLLCDLIKFPYKVELSNSCISTACHLMLKILSVADLVSEFPYDLNFLMGIFDVLDFTSAELETHCALWSIMAGSLSRIPEDTNASILHLYVVVLWTKSPNLIRNDIKNLRSFSSCCRNSTIQATVWIYRIVYRWILRKRLFKE